MNRVRTTCRICESRCGVVVEVENRRAQRILPDPDHPVSRGHICGKGAGFAAVHHSDQRLTRPIVDGEPTSWTEAMRVTGERIRALQRAYGDHAIGLFSGNAAGHSLGAVLGVSALQGALRTSRHYSALTLDNSEQFVMLEEVVGSPLHPFAADFAQSDLVVLIGTDMLASQPAQSQSNPRGIGHLRRIAAERALWVLDPRRSATAKAGRHLPCRPGSDVAVLGWLLREALARAPADARIRAGDLDVLAQAVANFDLPAAAAASGVDPAELQALCDALLTADRPIVWSGLGVLLGRDGTLGYWLTLCLQTVLGGLDTPGGWRTPPVPADLSRITHLLGLHARHPTLRGTSGFPAILDTVASADLAADITHGRLKALIVVGGNPALSLPDHRRVVEALGSLELLVVVDLFTNDTATLADVVLPARSWLAREDVPLHLLGQRWADGEPVSLDLEPAAVPPVGEAREDFDILRGLATAIGRPAFGSRAVDFAVRRLRPTQIGRLAGAALRLAGPSRPLGRSHHRDGTLHLAVPEFVAALSRWQAPHSTLRLITSARPIETMNHWLHQTRAAQRRRPIARMHPATAAEHGVQPGMVRIVGEAGVEVELVVDPSLRTDVIVLPFGWGHLDGAVGSGGVCANVLVGTSELEPFTGQPVSNGQAVTVEPVTR